MRAPATIALMGLLSLPPALHAQTTPIADSVYHVKCSTLAATPMAAWKKGSELQSASGDAAKQAPRKSVRYSAKLVPWPTATVKEIVFTKKGGGVLHPITDEKTVYVLSGSVATTVDGKPVTLAAGDLASLPSGALTSPGKPADAVVIAWTAAGLTPGATPAVVRGADVQPRAMGGLTLKRYEFPGNSVRVAAQSKGFKTTANSAKTDSLIRMTKGPARFFQNGQEFLAEEGDFIREVAGLQHNWDCPEDSGFVTTSALPIGAGPIDASKATDIPPAK
jgi:quercetin dioxygenase-like cupin family protein